MKRHGLIPNGLAPEEDAIAPTASLIKLVEELATKKKENVGTGNRARKSGRLHSGCGFPFEESYRRDQVAYEERFGGRSA